MKNLKKLKKQFPLIQISDWENLRVGFNHKCNSLGLKNEDKLHLNFEKISKVIFYDVIYNPSVTNFLKEAEKTVTHGLMEK